MPCDDQGLIYFLMLNFNHFTKKNLIQKMHHSQSAPIILGICLNNDYNLQFPHHHVRSVPFLNWTYQNKILLWWMQAGFHLFLYNTVLVDVWNGSLLLWTLQIHIYTYKWVCLTSVTFKTSFLTRSTPCSVNTSSPSSPVFFIWHCRLN